MLGSISLHIDVLSLQASKSLCALENWNYVNSGPLLECLESDSSSVQDSFKPLAKESCDPRSAACQGLFAHKLIDERRITFLHWCFVRKKSAHRKGEIKQQRSGRISWNF